jgi:hypothetical protein
MRGFFDFELGAKYIGKREMVEWTRKSFRGVGVEGLPSGLLYTYKQVDVIFKALRLQRLSLLSNYLVVINLYPALVVHPHFTQDRYVCTHPPTWPAQTHV